MRGNFENCLQKISYLGWRRSRERGGAGFLGVFHWWVHNCIFLTSCSVKTGRDQFQNENVQENKDMQRTLQAGIWPFEWSWKENYEVALNSSLPRLKEMLWRWPSTFGIHFSEHPLKRSVINALGVLWHLGVLWATCCLGSVIAAWASK